MTGNPPDNPTERGTVEVEMENLSVSKECRTEVRVQVVLDLLMFIAAYPTRLAST